MADVKAFFVKGKRVPSVSTIVGQLDKPGLVKWAHDLGLQGVEDLYAHVDVDRRAGKLAHALLLGWLAGNGLKDVETLYADKGIVGEYTEEEIQLSRKVLDRAMNLCRGVFNGFETELMEHSFTSEKHLFGGRIDWYGVTQKRSGPRTLVDFVTSKAIYNDKIIQTSAYWGLMRENGYSVECAAIVRVGAKAEEGEEVHIMTDEQLDAGFETFLHLRKMYDLKKIFTLYTGKTRKAA